MEMRESEHAVIFDLWTMHGTWFWSLIYPDRHGGAVGAAISEAEALREAHAAMAQMPQSPDLMAPVCDHLNRWKYSTVPSDAENNRTNDEIRDFDASPQQGSRLRIMGHSYNRLWQLRLSNMQSESPPHEQALKSS